MAQSVYKVTTDQGEYHVTVDEPEGQAHMAAAPASGDALAENVYNLGAGALKTAARVGQMIPGMATATDKLYHLPAGASVRATQPSNTGQRVGGAVADLALGSAIGAADLPGAAAQFAPGIKVTSVKNVAQGAADAVKPVLVYSSRVLDGAAAAARTALVGSGPITPEKIGAVVGKYGAKAVGAAMTVLGLGAGWAAWEALKK